MSNDKVAATVHGAEEITISPEPEQAEHTEPKAPEVQHGTRPDAQPTVEHSGPTGVVRTERPEPAEQQAPAEGTEEPEGTETPTEGSEEPQRPAERP